DYSRLLLLPSEYGTWFAGWYPHALLVLAVLVRPSGARRRQMAPRLPGRARGVVRPALAPGKRTLGAARSAHLPLPVLHLDPARARAHRLRARAPPRRRTRGRRRRRGGARAVRSTGRRSEPSHARRLRRATTRRRASSRCVSRRALRVRLRL